MVEPPPEYSEAIRYTIDNGGRRGPYNVEILLQIVKEQSTPPPKYSETIRYSANNTGNRDTHNVETLLQIVKEQSTVIYNLEQQLEEQKKEIGKWRSESDRRIKTQRCSQPPPGYFEAVRYGSNNITNNGDRNIVVLSQTLKDQSTVIRNLEQEVREQRSVMEKWESDSQDKEDAKSLAICLMAVLFVGYLLYQVWWKYKESQKGTTFNNPIYVGTIDI
ncbi:hypothetical protein FO519_003056 [Halicephalobus sp. NKZ332]|nr:hypothetical protein FO519_003056 [Halicephalobus sp. NKZ332]